MHPAANLKSAHRTIFVSSKNMLYDYNISPVDLERLEVIYVSDEASEVARQLDSLLDQYAAELRTVANYQHYVDTAVAKAKSDAHEKFGDTVATSLASAERLRQEIFAYATNNRTLLADGKNYIALNNGTVKWHTTKTWEIDVSDTKLLQLIRRLRAVRLVVDVKRTVSKQKLNQNPWIYKLLEKLKAAHYQQTTTFAIDPIGFKIDPKNDPNKIVASSERIHEE
jgi:hypothetical protein